MYLCYRTQLTSFNKVLCGWWILFLFFYFKCYLIKQQQKYFSGNAIWVTWQEQIKALAYLPVPLHRQYSYAYGFLNKWYKKQQWQSYVFRLNLQYKHVLNYNFSWTVTKHFNSRANSIQFASTTFHWLTVLLFRLD